MFEDVYNALVDALLFIPRVLYWLIIDPLSSFFSTLGVDIDLSPLTALSNFTEGNFGYFVDAFQLNYGIGLVVSALVIRFLIRRLPLIG